jgi:PAS domain S-box-containing protein
VSPAAGTPLRVLILEDNPADAELLAVELEMAGFELAWDRVDNAAGFRAGLLGEPDVVLADYRLPQFDAVAALAMAEAEAPGIPVIVVSGAMSEEACVQCLRLGAVDYLLKDRLARLGPAVRHALARRQLEAARRRAEQSARDAAATMQELVDASPALIYLTDGQGRYLLVNSEFERVCGLGRGELVGRCAAGLTGVEFAPRLAERDACCLRTQAVSEAEEVLTIGGEVRTYVSIRYPLPLPGGGRGVAAIHTDISRQKKVEDALRTTQAELHEQASVLSLANAELQQLDAMRSRFIATVSHELRTPLTSIRGYTELLAADESLPPAARRLVAVIDRNGQRLLRLIEDLLDFARIESGAAKLDLAPVDVADLVTHCRTVIYPAARTAGLGLACDVPGGLPPVLADRQQLERVLLNLLSNAVKFSPDGGSITVSARQATEGEVALTVSDSGIGIPADEQGRLFTSFSRSSITEKRAISGTGLGLAICKGIIDAHRGRITVDSAVGTGTTVTVTLAVAERRWQPEQPTE